MFRKALIAVDLDSMRPLLDCASDLRAWGIDHLVLAHFIRVGYAQGPAYGHEDRSKEKLNEHAETLRSSGFRVDVRVNMTGDVGGSLATLASEVPVDLLVVGSRSQNIIEQAFLGSVARKVLRRSTVPVLVHWIEPTEGSEPVRCELTCATTLRHVLLVTDLTSGSRAAHDVVIELAARGARVDCVHIAESSETERFPDWEVMSRAVLEGMNQRIIAAGGTGEVIVDRGDPVERVLDLASQRDVSLLVVGKRGRHFPEHLTMGSTAKKLSKRSRRPVLMVPGLRA
jgi:nucleotide-binding universal stress UspA family protein